MEMGGWDLLIRQCSSAFFLSGGVDVIDAEVLQQSPHVDVVEKCLETRDICKTKTPSDQYPATSRVENLLGILLFICSSLTNCSTFNIEFTPLHSRDVLTLIPWLMEPGGSMPHSQGLSDNPYPELNQPNYTLRSILILSSRLRLGLPKSLFPVGLPVKILKVFLPSSILATCPVHLNLLDLITLTILR